VKRPSHKQEHDRLCDEKDNIVSLASRCKTQDARDRAGFAGARRPAGQSNNDDDETGPPAA
jgi:hypothetical protein